MCNEFTEPISASLGPYNTFPFKEMSQRCRVFGNTVPDLTGPRFEPLTFRSRDEHVTAHYFIFSFSSLAIEAEISEATLRLMTSLLNQMHAVNHYSFFA